VDQLNLQPLDGQPPYPYVDDELRKVARDAYVSWQGSRYSVPWEYAGRSVWVRERGSYVEVHYGRDRSMDPPDLERHHNGLPVTIDLRDRYTSVALGAIIQPAWKSEVMVIEFEFIAVSPDESARIVVSEPENQQRLEAAVTLSDPYPTGQRIPRWFLSAGKVSLGGPF
jgi:hypothetical protein